MTRPPPDFPGLSWRAATIDDAGALARLHAACYEVDGGYLMVPTEYHTEIADENNDPEHDTRVAVDPAGEIAAFGLVHISGGDESLHRSFPWGHVHPEHRRKGIGTALLAWMEARAQERFAAFADTIPRVIRVSAYDSQQDRIDLFERHGFGPVRYFSEMIRDLSLPLPVPEVTAGITIRAWDGTHSEAARTVHNDAFADHWGSQPITEYSWNRWHDEFFLPDASFLAWDGEQAVAYLTSGMYPHDFASRGRTEAWIEGLGTIRSHRGRGIASALLIAAMSGYRDRDLEYAALGVDADNPTGAFGLYSRLGFETEKSSTTFEKSAD